MKARQTFGKSGGSEPWMGTLSRSSAMAETARTNIPIHLVTGNRGERNGRVLLSQRITPVLSASETADFVKVLFVMTAAKSQS